MAVSLVALLVLGLVGVVLVLYLAERLRGARRRARRLQRMSDRLAAATRRAEQEHEQRQASAEAGAALTAYIPAINQPELAVPGTEKSVPVRRKARLRHSGVRLAQRSGEHPVNR
jgi:hypothetical protein